MQIAIPSDLEPFVESAIQSGDYHDAVEVVTEGLRLLKCRRQLQELVNVGAEQLERGEYTEYDDQSHDRFVADIEAEQRRLFPG